MAEMPEGLREILAGALGEVTGSRNLTDSTPPKEALARLTAAYQDYTSTARPKPGDLVTIKPSHNLHGVGDPHIVLEVRPEPVWSFYATDPADTGHAAFGRGLNVRVACIQRGDTVSYWMEHWVLEPYVGQNLKTDGGKN